jgi:5-enolpyruvylshikimate-3-phosphate synthase
LRLWSINWRHGAEVSETPDGHVIQGVLRFRRRDLDAHGDQRIAMAMAVLALFAKSLLLFEM